MRRCRLPDGLEIFAPSALEAGILYREIVAERTYERHGITIRQGDVVFDIGANIGLFSIHVARTVPGVRLYAFEPVPPVFAMLKRNLEDHAPGVTAFNVGIADRDGDAMFEFDPFMTINGSMDQQSMERAANRKASATAWAAAAIADLHRTAPSKLTAVFGAALERPVLNVAALAVLAPAAALLGLRKRMHLQRHRCRLSTAASAMQAAGVSAIDLMKVDVEGAEEAVISGIGAAGWPRIRQLVIEVHDVDGRLARLRALLERHGFQTTIAREDWALHELLGISTLYATRA